MCGAPAVTHMLSDTNEHGMVGLTACEEHVSVARHVGHYLAEHPYRGWCGMPGTGWSMRVNACLIDATAVDPHAPGVLEPDGELELLPEAGE